MVQYILECVAFQLAFLVIYDFFLKKETFFQWNRVYLIGTYLLSLVLPWIKIEALKTSVPEAYAVYPDFLWNTNSVAVTAVGQASPAFQISWQEGVLYGGMVVAAIYFGYKLFQLYQLGRNGKVERFPNFTRIVIKNSELAFSFFRSIFLGDKILEREHSNVIKHELVHIEQRHTLDLLFFELMRIVGWFNPLVYVYQNRIAELHEFIADAQVPKAERREHYDLLLSQIFQTQNTSFVNQFYKKSLTRLPLLDRILTVLGFGGQVKKRIVMLQKSKSKKVFQLKYLLLVPLVLGMLVYTSCEKETKLTVDTELSSEDEALISMLNEKLGNSNENLINTYSEGFFQKFQSDDYLLTKEEFFEHELTFRKIVNGLQEKNRLENLETKPFDFKIPLPSEGRYQAYIKRKKASQLLDPNLKELIRAYSKEVSLIQKSDDYPSGYLELKVSNSKKMTRSELGKFNNMMLDLELPKNRNTNIVITDNTNAFHIYIYIYKTV